MRPELFKIGGLSVHGYGLMIGIGFIAALFLGCYRAKKKQMSDEAVIDIAILAGLCGFLGAKLLYVIVDFGDFLKDPLAVLGSSGFVLYGGVIAGVFVGWLYTHIKKLSFMEYFDLIMPEIALAQGFGRIGCFLAGCCYGRETDSWFGVVFPPESMSPSGIKLIPTQLISAVGDFVIVIVLIVLADIVFKGAKKSLKYGHVAGDIGCTYMFVYGIGRFLIEFLRNDYRGEIGFLSTSQFISILIVAGGALIMILNRKKLRSEAKN